jgi:hypothetical protein
MTTLALREPLSFMNSRMANDSQLGHQGRGDQHALGELDRAGHADADGDNVFLACALPAQHAVRAARRRGLSSYSGGIADVGRLGIAVEDAAAEVGQRQIDAGRADVHAGDIAVAAVHGEQLRAPATLRIANARFDQGSLAG